MLFERAGLRACRARARCEVPAGVSVRRPGAAHRASRRGTTGRRRTPSISCSSTVRQVRSAARGSSGCCQRSCTTAALSSSTTRIDGKSGGSPSRSRQPIGCGSNGTARARLLARLQCADAGGVMPLLECPGDGADAKTLPAAPGDDEPVVVTPGRQAARGQHGLERFLRRQAIDGAVENDSLDTSAQLRIGVPPPYPVMTADPLQQRAERRTFKRESRGQLVDPAPPGARCWACLASRRVAAGEDQRLPFVRYPSAVTVLDRDSSLAHAYAQSAILETDVELRADMPHDSERRVTCSVGSWASGAASTNSAPRSSAMPPAASSRTLDSWSSATDVPPTSARAARLPALVSRRSPTRTGVPGWTDVSLTRPRAIDMVPAHGLNSGDLGRRRGRGANPIGAKPRDGQERGRDECGAGDIPA